MSKIIESISFNEDFSGEYDVWGVHELVDGVAYLMIPDFDKKTIVIQDTANCDHTTIKIDINDPRTVIRPELKKQLSQRLSKTGADDV